MSKVIKTDFLYLLLDDSRRACENFNAYDYILKLLISLITNIKKLGNRKRGFFTTCRFANTIYVTLMCHKMNLFSFFSTNINQILF